MSSSATYHSINRAKERHNFKNQRAAEKNIALAIKNGKRADSFSSWEREFLLGEERDGCSAIAYNNFCYIVNSENVCITLYPLPVWFGKKKRFEGKERIRDYKKYHMNYIQSDEELLFEELTNEAPELDETSLCDGFDSGYSHGEIYSGNAGFETVEQGDMNMSRDWTPREHYLVEQQSIQEGRGDYWNFLSGIEWVPADKEPVRLVSDEEIELRKQFPVLGKFLESFTKLYERLSKYENGIEFLKMQDLELQEYIATGNHNPESCLVKWFEGELDKHFYYREHNDELLIECVCEEAMLHAGKQYDAYFEYRIGWYIQNGIGEAEIAQFKKEYLEDVEDGRFEGTFHQYEMEFGYENIGIYDSFDAFLEKKWLEILERHQSVREGDFVDVVVDSHCQGLAKVLDLTENGLFLEMIDGHYSTTPPNAGLSNNPFEADYNVILELRVVDPKNYHLETHHETVSELISDAKTRSESFASNDTDKIVDFEKGVRYERI